MQCECGHQKEFHDPKLYPLNGSKCIGGRCGCSGFKAKITAEEAALVRKVLATGYTAPMHERHEARRIVDRFLPPMPYTGRGRGMPLAFGDAANC